MSWTHEGGLKAMTALTASKGTGVLQEKLAPPVTKLTSICDPGLGSGKVEQRSPLLFYTHRVYKSYNAYCFVPTLQISRR